MRSGASAALCAYSAIPFFCAGAESPTARDSSLVSLRYPATWVVGGAIGSVIVMFHRFHDRSGNQLDQPHLWRGALKSGTGRDIARNFRGMGADLPEGSR